MNNKPKKEVELHINLFDDKILVKELPKEDQSAGGIIIPGQKQGVMNPMAEGQVIKTGPGRKNEKGEITPMRVKPGHKIFFLPTAGHGILIKGKEHIIMNQGAVIATFETKIKPILTT